MGCNISLCSRNCTGDGELKSSKKSAEPKQYSWDLKKNIDVSQYTVDSLVDGETGRIPGSINGQQFQIKNCVNSHIYIYDWSNTVTIDDCKHCKIFIGPVKGSLFVRDCSDCAIVVACGQFRTRDCTNLDVFIHVNTQPIIESSSRVRLGCFQYWYEQLESQIYTADLSPWQNFWWRVHDFTPVEGGKNWSKLGSIFKVHDCLPLHEDPAMKGIDISTSEEKSVVPLTVGTSRSTEADESCLVAIFHSNSQDEMGRECLKMMRQAPGVFLVRTAHLQIRKADAERLFPSWMERVESGRVLCLQLGGVGCNQIASKFLINREKYVWISADRVEKDIQGLFGLCEMTLGF